ncbi:uncharacterized protein [Chelonus insularis]|uniref:uncharacterized protein n=1 Tax=Chelonus insularis TaxID=460826 RepID=UPI00158D064C|nr:uncharacterized protein LOC118067760 [Chelonus insularis]
MILFPVCSNDMRVSWLLKYGLVLVLVLVVTSVESLTGNVCTRIENYTETRREPYQKTLEVLTTSWCFSLPPRCTRSKTIQQTYWKIQSEEKQRNVSECCPGYTMLKLWDENSENYIESCVAHSDCKPGYIGKNCTTECPVGTWGVLCKNTCNCNPLEICSPTNGSCYCPAGWKGLACDNKCEEGKWGVNCSTLCDCTNGSRCHHETGACVESIDESHEDLTENSFLFPFTVLPLDNYDNLSNNDVINANFLEPTDTAEVLLEAVNNTQVNDEIILSTMETVVANELNTENDNTSVLNVTTGPLGNIAEKVQIPAPANMVIFIIIGSIISFVSAIIALFSIRHIRTKLCKTIRLSIYDLEGPDTRPTTLPNEKGNEGKINPICRTSEIPTPLRDYETPKSIPLQPSFTSPRINDVIIRESTYYNQYPNIHFFNTPQELLEAQYDKPLSINAFSQLRLEFFEGEHLYDEIPLQSTPDDKSDHKSNVEKS